MPAALFKWHTIGYPVQFYDSSGPAAGRIESMGPEGLGGWSGTVYLSVTGRPGLVEAEYSETVVPDKFGFPGGLEPILGFAKQVTEIPALPSYAEALKTAGKK